MNCESVIASVFQEIDILVREQISIINHNAVIEDRRKRFICFLQSSEVLQISSDARENLLQNVYDMEINVVRKAQTVLDKPIEVNIEKRCRYSNKGYCKYDKSANLNILHISVNNS